MNYLFLLGAVFMYSTFLLVVADIYLPFLLSGQTQVLIDINSIGEAWLEAVLIVLVGVPLATYSFVKSIRMVADGRCNA